MLKVTLAGRAGKNAEHRTTQSGTDICNFSVACDVGFGENKQTLWVDVSKFGKGARGLSGFIRKGDPITVVGDFYTHEHNGKTYLKCNADNVALQGSGKGERKQGYDDRGSGAAQSTGENQSRNSGYDDLDDQVPFD